ncbi:GNAT family acetyltransferase [Brevibacillus panacihumi W25]|uniref:GNAT family acetyltransferase n=1 Tax=Brevibacillus panacihumi W25 TaxID=1408254 RepID=V6MC51_9BACL|nr:GNAT family N-acetyltransferase [Brevibacillus panacihumi]EST55837.1 GNAT family acetyltransferase [Brevibacillus panacihumi W25]
MLPNFETQRLSLRPRVMADFDACYEMDRDPEVTKYIRGPWHDPAMHRQFLSERLQKSWGDGLGYWSIFEKDEPTRFVGWILLIPTEEMEPQIEIGWRLNRLAWGKGYATEAACVILEHAFQTVKVARIVADIDSRNRPSVRVAEKIGLKYVCKREHDGVSSKYFALTAEEYYKLFP